METPASSLDGEEAIQEISGSQELQFTRKKQQKPDPTIEARRCGERFQKPFLSKTHVNKEVSGDQGW
jgi:hypothetical protein